MDFLYFGIERSVMMKNMKKHFSLMFVLFLFVSLLAVTAAAQDYNIIVGGVQVTDENKSDILGDGKVSYDSDTNTLTLDNASVSSSFEIANNSSGQATTAVLYSTQELNILVRGACAFLSNAKESYNDYTIYCELPNGSYGDDHPDFTIRGYDENSTLIVSSADTKNETSAIYTMRADVVVENIKSLHCFSSTGVQSNAIQANDAKILIDHSDVFVKPSAAQNTTSGMISALGVYVSGASNVEIEGSKINATGESESYTYGIFTLGTVEVSGASTLYAKAGEVSSVNSVSSFGICGASGIVVKEGSKLDGRGAYAYPSSSEASSGSVGVFGKTILVTGNSEINGECSSSRTASAGVYGETITVEDSVVYGFCPMSVSNGSAIASNSPVNGAKVYDYENKFILDFVAPSDERPGYFVDESGNPPYKMIAASNMEYDVWVGGVRVTSQNCDDVFGDGTVSYNHKTRKLTLNNAHITDSYVYDTSVYHVDDGNGGTVEVNKKHSAGLFFKFPIEINVMGDVVIDCSDNTDDYNFGICFDRFYSSSDGVVISGEGDGAKLTVKSGGVEESVGVQIDEGGCVVKNIELDVLSGNADKSSCAFFSADADDQVIFDNSVVVLQGGDVKSGTTLLEKVSAGLVGGGVQIINGSNVTVGSGDVYPGEESTICAGAVLLGYCNLKDGSTLTAMGGDVYAEGGTAVSYGLVSILCVFEIGDDCCVNATGGDVHYDGEATIENAQSVGFSSSIACTRIGDNAVLNAYGGYSDGGSAGVYIVDESSANTDFIQTIYFLSKSSVLNAGTSNTNKDAISIGIYSDRPFENATVRDVETGEILTHNGGLYMDSNGNLVNSSTVNGGIVLIGDYNLVVGGVIVTKQNKDDIFGENDEGVTAWYDEETNTLTLENADIDTLFDMDGTYAGLLCYNELNINLSGYNRIDATNYPEMPYTGIGVGIAGDLAIYSEKDAVLEVISGKSYGENYAVYLIPVMEGATTDLTVSGKAALISRAGDVDFESSSTTSAGIFSNGKINVLDSASIFAYGGKTLPSETNTNSSFNAMSVGIAALDKVYVNTKGKLYGYGDESVTVYGGMGFLGGLEVANGMVIGEACDDAPEGSTGVGLCTMSDVENVNVKTGSGKDDLNDAIWYYLNSQYGGAYVTGTGNVGKYTVIVSEKYFGNIETSKDINSGSEDDENGEDNEGDFVRICVNGYENAFIVFAAYDANGRMTDMCLSHTCEENTFGTFECTDLDLTDAVMIKSFLFEAALSANPLCEQLERNI